MINDSGALTRRSHAMRMTAAVLVLASGALLLGACTRTDSPDSTDAAATGDAPVAIDAPADPTGPDTTMIDAGFDCGGLPVAATFDNAAETATLSWPDRQLVLPQAISASGARYVDTAGNEFWNKGDEATLTLVGEAPIQCSIATTTD